MGSRPVLAVGLAACAGLAGWLLYGHCGGDSATRDLPTDAQRAGSARHSPAAPGTGPSPSRPGDRDRPRLDTPGADRFEDEVVDPGWAAPQSRSVARVVRAAIAGERLTGVVDAGEVECRSTHCRFVLSVADADRMGDAIALLENSEDLRADAATLKLSNLRPTSVTVTLAFEPIPPAPDPPVPDPEDVGQD